MMHRRRFIEANLLALTTLALARPGRAQTAAGKRFLFIHAEGGWDPLCVFAPLYDADGIDMEAESQPMQIGDFALVDHPLRPAVRRFFERFGDRTVVLNGVSTRSVNHETCQAVSLTGSTSDTLPDWATLLARGARRDFDLPHIVFSGPVFAGPYTVLVSRAQGALAPLLEGQLIREEERRPLSGPAGRMVDAFLSRRAAGLERGRSHRQLTDLAEAHRRAMRLRDRSATLDLRVRPGLRAQAETALSALASGLCRCASVGTQMDWDTHLDNSLQIGMFEALFGDIQAILERLDATPGPDERPLADDTVVVVTSEMGRTPAYNGTQGRDHWPYTSMLLIGRGIGGGRILGGYDQGFNGLGVGAGGVLDAAAPGISTEDLGATLLALGDVDPADLLPFATPIPGILS